mgnify:CR=1 FL=1
MSVYTIIFSSGFFLLFVAVADFPLLGFMADYFLWQTVFFWCMQIAKTKKPKQIAKVEA